MCLEGQVSFEFQQYTLNTSILLSSISIPVKEFMKQKPVILMKSRSCAAMSHGLSIFSRCGPVVSMWGAWFCGSVFDQHKIL